MESQQPKVKQTLKERKQESKKRVKNLQAVREEQGEVPEETVSSGMHVNDPRVRSAAN